MRVDVLPDWVGGRVGGRLNMEMRCISPVTVVPKCGIGDCFIYLISQQTSNQLLVL